MFVCVRVTDLYVYMYICVCVCVYYACMCDVYGCTCACAYTCLRLRMCACVFACECAGMCVRVCMHIVPDQPRAIQYQSSDQAGRVSTEEQAKYLSKQFTARFSTQFVMPANHD